MRQLLAGYRQPPEDPMRTFEVIAHALAVSRLVHVEVRANHRRPWLRLAVQEDDVRIALRDDPLVNMVLAAD